MPPYSDRRKSRIALLVAARQRGEIADHMVGLGGLIERAAGAGTRVNMRLIDGQTGLHVWAESLARPSSDLMSVRDAFVRDSVLRSWIEVRSA